MMDFYKSFVITQLDRETNFHCGFSFQLDLYVNISSCFLSIGQASDDLLVFLQLLPVSINFPLTFVLACFCGWYRNLTSELQSKFV